MAYTPGALPKEAPPWITRELLAIAEAAVASTPTVTYDTRHAITLGGKLQGEPIGIHQGERAVHKGNARGRGGQERHRGDAGDNERDQGPARQRAHGSNLSRN